MAKLERTLAFSSFIILTALPLAGCLGGAENRRGGFTADYDGPVIETKDKKNALFEGRFFFEKDGARFSWSGSAISVRFRGTGASVVMDDSGKNRFFVLVDGKPLREKVVGKEGRSTIPLVKGLPRGEHTLTLYKLTEPLVGETVVFGFVLDENAEPLPAPAPKARSLLVIGDSISAGYGNEDNDPARGFDPNTENHFVTYAARAARELDSSLVTVAWSGRGVYSNRGSTVETLTMKDLWTSVLPESKHASAPYDFSDAAPEAVVINLGTNDFAPEVNDTTPFAEHYDALLTEVRGHYPEAELVLSVGPSLNDSYPPGRKALSTVRTALQKILETRKLAGDSRVSYLEFPAARADEGLGADYHPTEKTHRRMAAELISHLKTRLGW